MSTILLVIAGLAGAGLAMVQRPPPPSGPGTIADVGESPVIEVHVAGHVLSPGVVSVTEGAIVADAIAAAGGLTEDANPDAINLAASVENGDQIVVPGPDDAATSDGDGRISINRATPDQLEDLPGVGPVLAERIAAFRDTNGPFKEVEDLLQVPGVGEAKLSSIRDLIVVP